MSEWNFENSDRWYQVDPEQIKFDGEFNGIRCVFAVSVSEINDHFNSYDSRANAEENFDENQSFFYDLAIEAADGDEPEFDDDEPYFHFIDLQHKCQCSKFDT